MRSRGEGRYRSQRESQRGRRPWNPTLQKTKGGAPGTLRIQVTRRHGAGKKAGAPFLRVRCARVGFHGRMQRGIFPKSTRRDGRIRPSSRAKPSSFPTKPPPMPPSYRQARSRTRRPLAPRAPSDRTPPKQSSNPTSRTPQTWSNPEMRAALPIPERSPIDTKC